MPGKARPTVRAQLLLTPVRRERLERLARREGRKLSDVTRRAIDVALDVLEGDTDETLRRQLGALAALRRMREELQAERGLYQGDLVAEAREQCQQEWERVWDTR